MGLSYFVLVVIAISISLFAIFQISNLRDSINQILNENFESILAAEKMVKALEAQEKASLAMFFESADSLQAVFDQNQNEFLHAFEQADRSAIYEQETTILAGIDSLYQHYLAASDTLQLHLRTIGADREMRLYRNLTIVPITHQLKERCQQIGLINTSLLREAERTARSISRKAALFVITVSGCAILISILAAIYFARFILRPIATLTQSVRNIAEGQLDQRVHLQSNDELAMLGREFNRMSEKLREFERLNIGRLMQEQKKSAAIVDNIPDAIIVTDADDRILLLNAAAQSLLQLSGQWQNETIDQVIADSKMRQALKSASMTNPDAQNSEQLISLTQHENTIFLRVKKQHILDEQGHSFGVATLLLDVTPLKMLEQMKSNFMATVSHEFRTPLTSLSMSLDILLQEILGPLAPKQLELLQRAKQDYERMARLLKQLLELSKLESGVLPLEFLPTNIPELIDSALQPLQHQIQAKSITIQRRIAADLPEVWVDQQSFSWLISNLISNAIRCVPEQGKIQLNVYTEDDRLLFCVEDNGVGIPANARESIFDKFVQLDKGAPSTVGSVGLGLAIAREVVRAHSGKIWVESEVNVGSRFFFSIPIFRTLSHSQEKPQTV